MERTSTSSTARDGFQAGDHICAVFTSSAERASVAADFLAAGLARNERCWYVAAGREGPTVRAALRERGVNIDVEQRRTALNIIGGSASYVVHGRFDPEATMQVFNEAIEQALKDGFTGFRAAADMSWALRVKNGARRLIAYEALLRTLFASCGATGCRW